MVRGGAGAGGNRTVVVFLCVREILEHAWTSDGGTLLVPSDAERCGTHGANEGARHCAGEWRHHGLHSGRLRFGADRRGAGTGDLSRDRGSEWNGRSIPVVGTCVSCIGRYRDGSDAI